MQRLPISAITTTLVLSVRAMSRASGVGAFSAGSLRRREEPRHVNSGECQLSTQRPRMRNIQAQTSNLSPGHRRQRHRDEPCGVSLGNEENTMNMRHTLLSATIM